MTLTAIATECKDDRMARRKHELDTVNWLAYCIVNLLTTYQCKSKFCPLELGLERPAWGEPLARVDRRLVVDQASC